MEQPKEENSEKETISKLQKKSRHFKPRGAPKSVVQKFNAQNTAARFSRVTAPHCQFRGVGQCLKQTLLYLWYHLFQAQWARCDQENHKTSNHLVK